MGDVDAAVWSVRGCRFTPEIGRERGRLAFAVSPVCRVNWRDGERGQGLCAVGEVKLVIQSYQKDWLPNSIVRTWSCVVLIVVRRRTERVEEGA
jgi:hypothetical protein